MTGNAVGFIHIQLSRGRAHIGRIGKDDAESAVQGGFKLTHVAAKYVDFLRKTVQFDISDGNFRNFFLNFERCDVRKLTSRGEQKGDDTASCAKFTGLFFRLSADIGGEQIGIRAVRERAFILKKGDIIVYLFGLQRVSSVSRFWRKISKARMDAADAAESAAPLRQSLLI